MMVCKSHPKINPGNSNLLVHGGRGLVGSGESNTYCLAGAVGADDEGEGPEEGDDVLVVGVEAPDPLDEHLVHRTHLAL